MSPGPVLATRARVGFCRLAMTIVVSATCLFPGQAGAKSTVTLGYGAGDVWAAAVRFLRVDRNLPVREKDEAAGYVLFEVSEAGKAYRASLELVSLTDDAGRVSTQATLSIPQLPKRYETALLEQLAAKVREERGPPLPPRKPALPRTDAADGGKAGDATRSHPSTDGGLPRPATLPSP
jgi:hypothetical protein